MCVCVCIILKTRMYLDRESVVLVKKTQNEHAKSQSQTRVVTTKK